MVNVVVFVLALIIALLVTVIVGLVAYISRTGTHREALLEEMEDQRKFYSKAQTTALDLLQRAHNDKEIDNQSLRQELNNAHLSLALLLNEVDKQLTEQGDVSCTEEPSSSLSEELLGWPSEPFMASCSVSGSDQPSAPTPEDSPPPT